MDDDELALVSSLYGKGTIFGWLATILSCLISWTCNEHKRKSDSIGADFIAVLTLPSVATGHIIYQIRSLPGKTTIANDELATPTAVQHSRAIEAPLTVIETFMVLSVILFLVVFPVHCYKRAVLIAVVGLLCLATEVMVYLLLTNAPGHSLPRTVHDHFSRSFVSDTTVVITVILSLVLTCIAAAFCLAWYVFARTPVSDSAASNTTMIDDAIRALDRNRTRAQLIEKMAELERRQVSSDQDRALYISLLFSLAFLPASLVVSLIGMSVGNHGLSAGRPGSLGFWTGFGYIARRFCAAFIPRTTSAFAELDQAVAVAAGLTILALTLWGVGREWYLRWKEKRELRFETTRREVIRLTELRQWLAFGVEERQRPASIRQPDI